MKEALQEGLSTCRIVCVRAPWTGPFPSSKTLDDVLANVMVNCENNAL